MKPSYEIPVVFRILPTEEDTQNAIDQVVAWIEASNEFEQGKVTKIDRTRLGRRRLAYEIKSQRDGLYVLSLPTLMPAIFPNLNSICAYMTPFCVI